MKTLAGAFGLSCLFVLASSPASATDFLELVKTGTAQSVQAAIDHGQDVNVKSDFGKTPLMLAAERNPNQDVIAALCKAGADPNALDEVGLTPMMYAARANPNPAVISALLDAGADVNLQINGMTALMYAAWLNPNPKVVIILVDAGADVEARDLAGKTALDYARDNEKLTSSDASKKLEVAVGQASKADKEKPQIASTPRWTGPADEFWKWFQIGCVCTAATGVIGLLVATQYPGIATVAIGYSIGAAGALAASLMSTSGRTPGEVIGYYVFPVLLGDVAGVFLLPAVAVLIVFELVFVR